MANNCLVTKLKSTVDNSELEVLGTAIVRVGSISGGSIHIVAAPGEEVIVEVLDENVTITSVEGTNARKISDKKARIGEGSSLYDAAIIISGASAATLAISNKYGVLGLYRLARSIKGFSFLPKLQYFDTNLAVALDLSLFSDSPELKDFVCNVSSLFGEINSLGKCTQLTNLNITNSNVTGTIEEFVALQRSNGRTTGSIIIGLNMGKVTFENSLINLQSGGTLSWTADSITIS